MHRMSDTNTFCCDNGLCISSEERCDDAIDCVDASDEKDCKLVQDQDAEYEINRPLRHIVMNRFPTKHKSQFKTLINLSIRVDKIIDLKEINSEVTILFTVHHTWRDNRLNFDYLKDSKENYIDKAVVWIPKFRFGNMKEIQTEYLGDLQAVREGQMKENSHTELTMKQTYKGSENSMMMESTYQVKFVCLFDNIARYPFDKEFCTIEIVNALEGHKLIKFFPQNISYYGKQNVGQYRVENISMAEAKFMGNLDGVKVRIKLGRDFRNIFAVTFLPTILMNIINQATTYFDVSIFIEAIITVNITCMMVLSALYVSASNSLTPTAEIKYIDIWLLYSLIFPFIIILNNILIFFVQQRNLEGVNEVKMISSKKMMATKKSENINFTFETVLKVMSMYINPMMYIVFSLVYFLYGFFCL